MIVEKGTVTFYYGYELNKPLKEYDHKTIDRIDATITLITCGYSLSQCERIEWIDRVTLWRFIHYKLKDISEEMYKDAIKQLKKNLKECNERKFWTEEHWLRFINGSTKKEMRI